MDMTNNKNPGLNSDIGNFPAYSSEPLEENPSVGLDMDEDIVQGMTVSYTEISFNTQSPERGVSIPEDVHDTLHGSIDESEDPLQRPNNLQLNDEDCSQLDNNQSSLSNNRAIGFLNNLNGTVTQDGPMVSFVAEDLETKLKLSSPVSKVGESNVWSVGMPWLYRQVLTSQIPPVDVSVLTDLETEVGKIATSVDSLTENLAGILHSMSALTVECLETYRDVVCKTCDAVDLNIKSMYQLMAKCEELSKSMDPIYKLSEHIKEIKHFIDVFENTMC